RHLDVDAVLAVIVEAQRLGDPLALVVAGADADRVDAAAVAFRLRVDFRIAVDFRRRGEEEPRPGALGQPQHVVGAEEIYLGRGDRVGLVEWRRGRTGQVVDLAEFAPERLRHVV